MSVIEICQNKATGAISVKMPTECDVGRQESVTTFFKKDKVGWSRVPLYVASVYVPMGCNKDMDEWVTLYELPIMDVFDETKRHRCPEKYCGDDECSVCLQRPYTFKGPYIFKEKAGQ